MERQGQFRDLVLAALAAILVTPMLSPGQQVRVGEPAPNFAIPSLDGQRTIHLSDFRGRRLLIFAWASW